MNHEFGDGLNGGMNELGVESNCLKCIEISRIVSSLS